MYDDHLKLIGKCVVDFLLVLTELFFLLATNMKLLEVYMTSAAYDIFKTYKMISYRRETALQGAL